MPTTDANVSDSVPTFPCPLCGEPLPAGTEECTQCDWVKGYRHREPVTAGSTRDITAAALSVIPGLGHLFKGHIKSGVAYLVGTAVMLFFMVPMGMVAMGFQILLLPFYWVWVMTQAYFVSDLNAQSRIPDHIG